VGGTRKRLVLIAMMFAVAMTFIDQTIVAIAIPSLQRHLSISTVGSQWIINSYLLALAALFALGGRLCDALGRRRMVVIGVAGFAIASAACGLTPKGGIAEGWMIAFRALQGATAALMFPAAVGIVASAYPVAERGRAMALFFGISGGLTAVGPIAGGYLTQWTWRAIFWINIPVALIALLLIWRSAPDDERHPASIDYRGAVLITAAMGLLVLGLQQSSLWGWGSVATWACIVGGVALSAAFVSEELRCLYPLLQLRVFRDRGFALDNLALGLLSIVFVPFFFFASVYAQVALDEPATKAGLYLLYFFLGYVVASRIGGRILDRRGARLALVLGSAVGAVGFYLLAGKLTDLSLGQQWGFNRAVGRRRRVHAHARQHRCGQPRRPRDLWRGHGHHPDRPEHRGERRARRAGDDPRQPRQREHRSRAREGGHPGIRRPPRRELVRLRPGSVGHRPLRIARARRPARLRALDADRLLRHGGRDGGNVPADIASLSAGEGGRAGGRRTRVAQVADRCA
jgi:EmrB/QacA subfamily drug resistance transporter